MSAVTINSNIPALQAQRRLADSSSALTKVFSRLSSGQRITHASDDAAGLSISDSLRVDKQVYSQGIRNFNDGLSMLNIGEAALSELSNIVTRIEELAEQAANGTLGYGQRQSLDKEAQQLSKEYTRIAQIAEFNNIRMFSGSVSDLRMQGGFGTNGSVILNIGGIKGDGTLGAVTTYAMESIESFGISNGDLNGDGNVDLVTTGISGGQGYATIRLGNGNGTFQASLSYATGGSDSRDISLSDLNGDGVLDLITTGNSAGAGYSAIRLGAGNGTFGPSVSLSNGIADTIRNAIGDMNGDGFADLIAIGGQAGVGVASIRLGRGDGSFGIASTFTMEGDYSWDGTLGDVNGDGILDLVTAGEGPSGGTATIRLGNGNGTFKAIRQYVTEAGLSYSVALGDIDGNGTLDLVTGGYNGNGWATVRLGFGDGTFGSATSYATENQNTQSVALADLNGDGILDLMTNGSNSPFASRSTIRLGNGNGTFGAAVSFVGADGGDVLTLGDFNNDGVLDSAVSGLGAQVRLGATTSGVGALLPFSLQYRYTALQAMPDLRRAVDRISSHRGQIGSFQSRLISAINHNSITVENYAAAESQIRDTDVAQDTALMVRTRILQQAGASILAQANQQPQITLKLLTL